LCTFEHYPSVGLGEDYRFMGKEMIGSSLIVNGTVVHCAFFRKELSGSHRSETATGMMDSRRRRDSMHRRNMANGGAAV